MRVVLILSLLLTGCTVQLKDERIDPQAVQQLAQIVNNQGQALEHVIKALQEKGILAKQEQKK